MYYTPIAGAWTRNDTLGNEENDIFSVEVDGDVYVGSVQVAGAALQSLHSFFSLTSSRLRLSPFVPVCPRTH